MKITKKRTIIGVSVLALILLTGAVASGAGQYLKERFCNPEFISKRIDDKVAKLNLTDEQQARYEAIKDQFLDGFTDHRTEHRAFRQEMLTALAEPDPDVHGLVYKAKEKLNAIPEKIGPKLDLLVEFYDILDPEQQAMFRAEFIKHMEKHGRHGFRGKHGEGRHEHSEEG